MNTIQDIRKKLKPGNVIVFVSGDFNFLHPGHLRLLRFAREVGDFLVVGVLASGVSSSAVIEEEERLEGVKALTWVNHAFLLQQPPEEFIGELKPSIVVKGKEYEILTNPELDILQSYGGQLIFSSGDSRFSSIDLNKPGISEINYSSIEKPQDFVERHNFTFSDLAATLHAIKSLRVCVIGDSILDEYITCDPVGMSQEDPTLVVSPVSTESFLGGAGIVAAHAKGLGAQVKFFTVLGKDEHGQILGAKVEEYGVESRLLIDPSRPTTLKQRYRADSQTLLRVNHFRQHQISLELQQKIFKEIKSILDDIDVVIFSDFNFGTLPQSLVKQISEEGQKRGILMAADSQSSSQFGDVSRFKGMGLLTPTEQEARIAARNSHDGLVILAESLRQSTQAENIIVTLAEEGLLIHATTKDKTGWLTDRLPAMNKVPKDPAGAGDALMVSTAMALATGRSIWEAAYLGSLAAACQVGRIGNTPLNANDLNFEINQ